MPTIVRMRSVEEIKTLPKTISCKQIETVIKMSELTPMAQFLQFHGNTIMIGDFTNLGKGCELDKYWWTDDSRLVELYGKNFIVCSHMIEVD